MFFRERKVTRARFDTATLKEGVSFGRIEALKRATNQPRRFAQLFSVDQSRFMNAIEMHVAIQPRNIRPWPADVKPGALRMRRPLAILRSVSWYPQVI